MDAAQREKKQERYHYFPNSVPHRLKQDCTRYQKYSETGLRGPSPLPPSCPGHCYHRQTWLTRLSTHFSRCLQLAGIFDLPVLLGIMLLAAPEPCSFQETKKTHLGSPFLKTQTVLIVKKDACKSFLRKLQHLYEMFNPIGFRLMCFLKTCTEVQVFSSKSRAGG